MLCPRCAATELVPHARDNVVVDVCPSCRGIWLDRGELERLLAGPTDHRAPEAPPRAEPPRSEPPRRHDDDRRRYDEDPRRHKKKRLFDLLEDLFD